jgi:hypothetical protein
MPIAPVTTFRLESTLLDDTRLLGEQARVADPAWMLARQLQMGELAGEDAGTPVAASVWTNRSPITRFRSRLPDEDAGRGIAGDPVPIEIRAENEAPDASLRWAAIAAADYARRVAAIGDRATLRAYRAALATQYELAVPAGADAVAAALARRTFDGEALYRELAAAVRGPSKDLPEAPPVDPADRVQLLAAAKAFLAWFDALTGRALPRDPAWRPDRVEYQMAVAGPTNEGELVLAATECDDSTLDWSDFDVVAGAKLGAASDLGVADPAVTRFVPVPARYHGQPATRFWEFEDREVHLGGVGANPEDLATLLVVDYALRYGDDFFVVPLPLDVGTIVRIGALDVTDSFGRRMLLRAPDESHGALRAFQHSVVSQPGGPAVAVPDGALVLFPAVAAPLEGEPIEVLGLVRDELANVSWAVERTALGPTGTPIDQEGSGATGHADAIPATAPTADKVPTLRYALRRPVPTNWHPLLPDAADANVLRLGTLPPLPDEPARDRRTRLLRDLEVADGGLAAEEVTRHPRDIVRAWQYARDAAGRQHVWLGRRVRARPHAGPPPLEWDLAVPPDEEGS